MDLPLDVRNLAAEDLPELDWTGGQEHLAAIAGDLGVAATGELEQLVVALPNGRLVGFGAVDFRTAGSAATVWMVSVHDLLQSLGIGTVLIRALEDRARARGRTVVHLLVEHDNPQAWALYRRLGYVEHGSELDHWPAGGGRTYVTVCRRLRRSLR